MPWHAWPWDIHQLLPSTVDIWQETNSFHHMLFIATWLAQCLMATAFEAAASSQVAYDLCAAKWDISLTFTISLPSSALCSHRPFPTSWRWVSFWLRILQDCFSLDYFLSFFVLFFLHLLLLFLLSLTYSLLALYFILWFMFFCHYPLFLYFWLMRWLQLPELLM